MWGHTRGGCQMLGILREGVRCRVHSGMVSDAGHTQRECQMPGSVSDAGHTQRGCQMPGRVSDAGHTQGGCQMLGTPREDVRRWAHSGWLSNAGHTQGELSGVLIPRLNWGNLGKLAPGQMSCRYSRVLRWSWVWGSKKSWWTDEIGWGHFSFLDECPSFEN